MQYIKKIKGNKVVFPKVSGIGIIGKLVKSSGRYCKNLNFFRSRQDVAFVVLGHNSFPFQKNAQYLEFQWDLLSLVNGWFFTAFLVLFSVARLPVINMNISIEM